MEHSDHSLLMRPNSQRSRAYQGTADGAKHSYKEGADSVIERGTYGLVRTVLSNDTEGHGTVSVTLVCIVYFLHH